jgi:hypothetical protein
MALSPQDQAFYDEKLGWKGFLYLLAATMLVGAISWPTVLYLQDSAAGNTGKWDFHVVVQLALSGMLLGTIVSLLMFCLARVYLTLGWLPRRR